MVTSISPLSNLSIWSTLLAIVSGSISSFYKVDQSEQSLSLVDPIQPPDNGVHMRSAVSCVAICHQYGDYDSNSRCYSILFVEYGQRCYISLTPGLQVTGVRSSGTLMALRDEGRQYSANLALGKDALMSSVVYDLGPVNAVDGDNNTMIHTSDQLGVDDNPWLIIDFGERKLVVSVAILNRPVWDVESNPVNQRFREASIKVGMQENIASGLSAQSNLCFYQKDTIPPAELTVFPCSGSDLILDNPATPGEVVNFRPGRYLLLQLHYEGAVLTITEVFVSGYNL